MTVQWQVTSDRIVLPEGIRDQVEVFDAVVPVAQQVQRPMDLARISPRAFGWSVVPKANQLGLPLAGARCVTRTSLMNNSDLRRTDESLVSLALRTMADRLAIGGAASWFNPISTGDGSKVICAGSV